MKLLFSLLVTISAVNYLTAQIPYPGENPGKAMVKTLPGNRVIFENNVIKTEFVNNGKSLFITGFEDKKTNKKITLLNTALFEIRLEDSSIISSNDFILNNLPVTSDIYPDPRAETYAERLTGKKYAADLDNQKTGLKLHWEAILRDGSNYIRQIFLFTAKDDKTITGITLLKLPADITARREGMVDGSPIVCGNMFFAVEHPLSKVEQNETGLISCLPRLMPVISTVWGTTPDNQLRRGFLYYTERERSHPYQQVLHYNSWYDISWTDRKLNDSLCLDRIKVFGDSLIKKRNIQLKAYLFDDGWDDNKTLWQFNSGFPDGFTRLKEEAESYKSSIGVWLSPFGGYGNTKKERLEYGRKQNPPFETNANGFALAGPVYYKRFKEATGSFIKKYDVTMFKFDGVGAGSGAGITYQKDVEAFLKLINELKELKPDLYFSLTTGTWASVYWLFYGDNIWRGGEDTYMMGEGSKRQQWITYRDAEVYKNIVKRGPLYPLNALMTCGICIADNGYPGGYDMNDKDISDEIWSFFGTGTNLQELYVNPHKMNTSNWDCLADAVNWAKENESVLADVHWTGGDPAKGEVYGYAAWSAQKATLTLRNPSKEEKSIGINVAIVFELPDYVKNEFVFNDARSVGSKNDRKTLAQGRSFRITLQPFEVKVFDGFPKK